jgi:hypothetical protein
MTSPSVEAGARFNTRRTSTTKPGILQSNRRCHRYIVYGAHAAAEEQFEIFRPERALLLIGQVLELALELRKDRIGKCQLI